MKLTDYVAEKMADPSRGMIRGWLVMVWSLWALLIKPETFRVKDLEEPITLEMGGGQVLRLFVALAQVVLGVLKAVFSVCGIVLLLVYLLLSPFMIVIMRLTAHILARRSMRRRAKVLAEARAAMPPQ